MKDYQKKTNITQKIPSIVRVKVSTKMNSLPANDQTTSATIGESSLLVQAPKKRRRHKKAISIRKASKILGRKPKMTKRKKPTLSQMGRALENALKKNIYGSKKSVKIYSSTLPIMHKIRSDVSLYSINGKVPIINLRDIKYTNLLKRKLLGNKKDSSNKKKRRIEHLSDSENSIAVDDKIRSNSPAFSVPSLHSLGLTLSSDSTLQTKNKKNRNEKVENIYDTVVLSFVSSLDKIVKNLKNAYNNKDVTEKSQSNNYENQSIKYSSKSMQENENVANITFNSHKFDNIKVSLNSKGVKEIFVEQNPIQPVPPEIAVTDKSIAKNCFYDANMDTECSSSIQLVIDDCEPAIVPLADNPPNKTNIDTEPNVCSVSPQVCDETDEDDLISLFTGSIESVGSLQNCNSALKLPNFKNSKVPEIIKEITCDTNSIPNMAVPSHYVKNKILLDDNLHSNHETDVNVDLSLKSYYGRPGKIFLKSLCFNMFLTGQCQRANCQFRHTFSVIEIKERLSSCSYCDLFATYKTLRNFKVKYEQNIILFIHEFSARKYTKVLSEVVRDILQIIGHKNQPLYECLRCLLTLEICDDIMLTASHFSEPFYQTILSAALSLKDINTLVLTLKAVANFVRKQYRAFSSNVVLNLLDCICQIEISADLLHDAFIIFKYCEFDIFQLTSQEKLTQILIKVTSLGLTEYSNIINKYFKKREQNSAAFTNHHTVQEPNWKKSNGEIALKHGCAMVEPSLENAVKGEVTQKITVGESGKRLCISDNNLTLSAQIRNSIFGPSPNFQGKIFRKCNQN